MNENQPRYAHCYEIGDYVWIAHEDDSGEIVRECIGKKITFEDLSPFFKGEIPFSTRGITKIE